MKSNGISRRSFLRAGLFGTMGAAGVAALNWQGHTAGHLAAAHGTATPGPYGAGMDVMDMGSGAKNPRPLTVFSGVTAGMLLLYMTGVFIK